MLLPTNTDRYEALAHLRPFGKEDADSMAHPALLNNRLFLRSKTELACFELLD